jgi:N-acylneuraminate cytidylyltransferase
MNAINVIAVIPARSGSKGIKDKNIKIINGKPLIYWTVKTALESKFINRVLVSTDSMKYANIVKKYGAEVPLLRPKSISKDKSTDIEFFIHFIKSLKLSQEDLLVHLRPTTPYRDIKVINKAIKFFKKNINNYTALRSVHEMSESAYKTFEIKKNFLKSISTIGNIEIANQPRQSFPITYQANGYIDIVKVKEILSNNTLYGQKCFAFKTLTSYEIDNENDFNLIKILKILKK